MKKLVSLKSIMIGILSLIIIGTTTSVFATDSVLETGDNSTTTEVTPTDLNEAQTIPTDSNYAAGENSTVVSTDNNNVSTGVNTSSAYNTVDEDEEDDLPQTGIEDYNIGILLVICVAASIYTYKKMRDYKNV